MQSLKALDTYDATQKIRQYLEKSEQSVTSVESAELSFSSRLCSNILELFREVFLLLSNSDTHFLSRAEYINLERSFGQLKLWSDGYGVSTGELDDVLDKSRLLRRDTLKLLRSIGINLTERLLPQLFGKSSMTESLGRMSNGLKAVLESYHEDDGESTSSGETDDSLEDNVQEMTKDLQTDTLCLMELGELFREPVLDCVRDAEKSASHEALLGWAPHQAFCDKVGTRFPRAAQLLVARLGKANYERYIRCQQSRHDQEMKTVTQDSEDPPLYLAPTGSTFHDSGLGSSIPSARSYAETILSYGSINGRSVRVPALPSDGKSGKPFACLVCGKLVNISNNSAWKQHIYSDLRPWLCLDMSCSNGDTSFENRSDWVSHLALDHDLEPRWRSFECPLCHAETGAGKVAVTRHLGAHLEEISLAALPIDVDSESDSESENEDSPDLRDHEAQSETLPETAVAATMTPTEHGTRVSRQFKCPTPNCGKSYSQPEHLYRHQLNHEPKQIYKCTYPGCTREFVRQDLRNRHMDRHTAKGSALNRKDSITLSSIPSGSLSPETNRLGAGFPKPNAGPGATQHGSHHNQQTDTPQSRPDVAQNNFPPFTLPPSDFSTTLSSGAAGEASQSNTPATPGTPPPWQADLIPNEKRPGPVQESLGDDNSHKGDNLLPELYGHVAADRLRMTSQCLECRKHNLNCNRTSPICMNCSVAGRECSYNSSKLDKADQWPAPAIIEDSPSPEKHDENMDNSNGEFNGAGNQSFLTHPSDPKLDRTTEDVYGDALYSPHFAITSASPPTQAQIEISRNNGVFAERLAFANDQHLSAAQSSSLGTESPFRHGSPLAPQIRPSLVQQTRERQMQTVKHLERNMSRQSQDPTSTTFPTYPRLHPTNLKSSSHTKRLSAAALVAELVAAEEADDEGDEDDEDADADAKSDAARAPEA